MVTNEGQNPPPGKAHTLRQIKSMTKYTMPKVMKRPEIKLNNELNWN